MLRRLRDGRKMVRALGRCPLRRGVDEGPPGVRGEDAARQELAQEEF